MDIKDLHEHAQRLARLKPDFDAPVLTPQQLHPRGCRTEMDDVFLKNLGIACFNFLYTRKNFSKRPIREDTPDE